MALARVFGIYKDVIQIHDNKEIKFFGSDLIDVAQKAGRSVAESERHDLVLEMTVSGPEGCLPFLNFSNPYPIIGICQIQLGELLGSN